MGVYSEGVRHVVAMHYIDTLATTQRNTLLLSHRLLPYGFCLCVHFRSLYISQLTLPAHFIAELVCTLISQSAIVMVRSVSHCNVRNGTIRES